MYVLPYPSTSVHLYVATYIHAITAQNLRNTFLIVLTSRTAWLTAWGALVVSGLLTCRYAGRVWTISTSYFFRHVSMLIPWRRGWRELLLFVIVQQLLWQIATALLDEHPALSGNLLDCNELPRVSDAAYAQVGLQRLWSKDLARREKWWTSFWSSYMLLVCEWLITFTQSTSTYLIYFSKIRRCIKLRGRRLSN